MKKLRSHRQRRRQTSRSRGRGWLGIARKSLPLRMLSGVESLEDRQLLAANILASGVTTLQTAEAVQDLDLIVVMPSAQGGSQAMLNITVTSTEGSDLDPKAPVVMDSNGSMLSGTSFDDADGHAGQTYVGVSAGEYRVRVGGEDGSTGEYRVDVSLIGDVAADDDQVSEFESVLTLAAAVQTLGTSNFVTEEYYLGLGIDLSVNLSDPGMDGNGDGVIDHEDVALVRANEDLGTVSVELNVDGDPPVISSIRLASDTGVSDSDNISTVPNIVVGLTDASTIVSVTASLDGGSSVEVTPLVGDFNSNKSFVLDRSDLDVIAGGSLTEGPHTITFTATDELQNVSDPVDFSFTFIEGNQSPMSSGVPDFNAQEDAFFSRSLSNFFSDGNPGDPLTYDATLPDWLSLTVGGLLTGTPENGDVGDVSVTVTATDSQGATASDTFDITVENTNDPPSLVSPIPGQNAEEDVLFSFDFSGFFSDPDVGDTLTYSVIQADGFDSNGNPINGTALPDWLTADEVNGSISGTPAESDTGTYSIAIIAVDSIGETANGRFDLNVVNRNDPPELISPIPDQEVNEDEEFSIFLGQFFSDPDPGDTLTISIEDLPGWLSLDDIGSLIGTPGDNDIGITTLTVVATDSIGESTSDDFELTVNNIDDAPVVNDQSFIVDPDSPDGTIVGTIVATDDDIGDTLTYSIVSGNEDGIFSVNSSTGAITVADSTLLVDQSTETFRIQVADSTAPPLTDTAVITIEVTSNLDPDAVDDFGFSIDDNLVLSISADDLLANDTDPEGDSLNVAEVSQTSQEGATVELIGDEILYDPRTTDKLAGLREGQMLTDTFTYTVADGEGGTDTATVEITVNGVDVVAYTLQAVEVVDGDDSPISTIEPGGTFFLVASVQDVQTSPQGVFSAYIDVEYNGALATPTEDIIHSMTYGGGASGTNTTPGLLDEAGGVDGTVALGGEVFEVFRQEFVAAMTPGVIDFSSNPTEQVSQHPTLTFDDDINLPALQIVFGSTTLTITGSAAAQSSGVSLFGTNTENPYDVNGDAIVSPLDALLVVNAMDSGVANGVQPDVNADGSVTPLDALLVINQLVAAQAASPAHAGGGEGPGQVLVGEESDVTEAELSLAFDLLFQRLGDDLHSDFDQDDLAGMEPTLIDAINDVADADQDQQEALWDELADDLAAYLTSDLA